jgi:hypothetical protein
VIIRLAACVAALGLLSACSSGKPGSVVTITVPPSNRTSDSPGTGSTSSGSGTASSTTGTPSGTPSRLTKLTGTCDTLLPDYSISQAVGGSQLAGIDTFVVGTPDPAIGRLAYLNCRYGVTGTGAAAKAKIEIGISLYSAAEQAASRIAATVADYTAHGAAGAATTVNGQNATMLTGGVGVGYDLPLLVVASGQRTVAVNVAPAVGTGAKATTDASALATLALKRTGG